MSNFSFSFRILVCGLTAIVSLPAVDQSIRDFVFRLRGGLGTSTEIVLVPLASDENQEAILSRIQNSGPRLLVVYPDDSMAEDTVVDRDCTLRHASLEGGTTPSPTLLTYHRLNATSGQASPKFPIEVNFRGPTGSFSAFPEVVLPTLAPTVFLNKIVLVGRDRGPSSHLQTPFGPMSALEFQANTLETLWKNLSIKNIPNWVSKAGALATGALSIAILVYLPLRYAGLTLLLGLFWISLAWFLLARYQWALNLANPLLCILSSHLLFLGYRIRRQEGAHWKAQKEAHYARQLEEFKNNFISLFSHDLKTPISRIKALTQLALNEPPGDDAKLRQTLKSLDKANNELARLIGDILKVTKMESVSLQLQKQTLDINRTVESAVESLRFLADEKQIRFVLDLEPLFPIEGDTMLIREVVTNLIENAVKYGNVGSKVTIRTLEERGGVKVCVLDEGEGILPDELPRVTGKFYRGTQTGQASSGSGLGLYLAKYFVELHGGELEIRSELKHGTQVSFWLPSS